MITAKVLDSVQQIKSRCDTLIEDASEVQTTDVVIASNVLRESVNRLVEFFDKSPEKNSELQALKSQVDAKAVLLERLIFHRSGKYSDTIKLREFADTLYQDVTTRIHEITEIGNLRSDDALMWSSFIPFVMKLSVCSKQTCFELDKDDEEMIEKITREMSIYNKLKEGK